MTHLELFCGAGGLAVGLERAGFQTLMANDFDAHACETFKANFADTAVFCEDAVAFAERDLPEVDVVAGGPPCQSFSYAGKRLGTDDPRGQLFIAYCRVLDKVKPKVFVFENVRGLLSNDKGRTFERVRQALGEQGYRLYWKVMNANDYGVPQVRERVIVVGVRNDIEGDFVFPEPHEHKPTLGEIELEENPDPSVCESYSPRLKRLFSKIGEGEYWANHKDDPEVMAHVLTKNGRFTGGGQTGVLRRLSRTAPALTVLTSPQGRLTQRCHPTEDRPMSVRENARIQTFPDSHVFKGPRGSVYRQIGNAVPVALAYEIGLALKDFLSRLQTR